MQLIHIPMIKVKLWVAEDDVDEQIFLEEGFKKSDFFNLERVFFNGQELIEQLKVAPDENLPDLILSDLNMPKMNGIEVLEKVKSTPKLSNIPCVIFSTCDELDTLELCYSRKADAFIPKPQLMTRYNEFAEELKEVFEHILEDQLDIS